MIKDRDYTIIVDKSASMSSTDGGLKSRWEQVQEATDGLARKVHTLDPDGITIYTFNGSFKKYENTTPDKLENLWKENEPSGGTDLTKVLSDALGDFATRKAQGKLKPNGETIIVVTDGEPNDETTVAKTIVEASKKLDKDEELAILFLQIGKDPNATKFLKRLDDDLQKEGAKFDIVDVTTFEEAEGMTFTELLEKAVND